MSRNAAAAGLDTAAAGPGAAVFDLVVVVVVTVVLVVPPGSGLSEADVPHPVTRTEAVSVAMSSRVK